jgi:ABC-type glutathione transport system ATPase component
MQTQSAVDQIRERLFGIADIYNRLVLLVGHSGSGRTAAIRSLADVEKVPVLNVGAEISRRLLDLTERQRVLRLPKLLEEAVAAFPSDIALLDNTEVLFNPVLKQDPLS